MMSCNRWYEVLMIVKMWMVGYLFLLAGVVVLDLSVCKCSDHIIWKKYCNRNYYFNWILFCWVVGMLDIGVWMSRTNNMLFEMPAPSFLNQFGI